MPGSAATPSVRLSVIVPIFNAGATLSLCVEALLASIGVDDEIIVVDDGSNDGGAGVLGPATSARIRVARSEVNIGRGPIRNVGAGLASGNVLLFVDADVVVHPDTVGRVRTAFDSDPGRVALIGSYDDRPAAPNLVSQYRNLLHHHTHHTNGVVASHFWTGLGAVRTDVFRDLGGLDESRWAHDMEDVEFGHRLVDAGHRIDVMPEIQGTHLKRFDLRSMVETDLVHRAIPWSRLMLQRRLRSDRFVASWTQRVSVASAVATVSSAAIATRGRSARISLLLSAGCFLLVNLRWWRFLVGARSLSFALLCIPLHLVHAVTSAVGFALAAVCPGTPVRSTNDVGTVRAAR